MKDRDFYWRPRHPSGDPIHRRVVKDARPIRRIPPDEPLVPGLRRPSLVSAIGFHHIRVDDDQDE